MGQLKLDRIRKAVNQAAQVRLYAFSKTAETWWNIEGKDMPTSNKLQVVRFQWQNVVDLAQNLDRNIRWSISIAGGEMYVDTGSVVEHVVLGGF